MKADLLILVDDGLVAAEQSLNQATGENVVQACRKYLLLLTAYREKLYQLRGMPEICLQQSSLLARELVEQTRKAIRSSVEATTEKRNEIESLLKSFTSISGYEAAETLNDFNYEGFDNWEFRASGVRLKNNRRERLLSVQEAVETAARLRREAYVARRK